MPEHEYAIELSQLKKTYRSFRGPVKALQGLDLQVRRGEIFGYIGVNGAGKSTSIKIMMGLVRPDSGQAKIFGVSAGSKKARAAIGYLPEVANYHEFLTAQELLSIHARLAGIDRDKVALRCEAALDMVGLAARRTSRISEFSKGMKQRFGIAQALVGDPPLLILDELTSGLDPFAQKDLREILAKLKEREVTVFFSSHHMDEVESICDRAAILHRGLLRACGTMSELTENTNWVTVSAQVPAEAQASFPQLDYSAEGLGSGQVRLQESEHFLAQLLQKGGHIRSYGTTRNSLEERYFQITREADSQCTPS